MKTLQPRVIKTEAQYAAALAHVESLMDATPDTAEEAELELWSLLVEKYEEEYFPIAAPDAVSAIRFRMEQLGLDRSDLLPYIPGGKSKVSEILSGRRPLSLPMMRKLNTGLNIPAEVLLRNDPPRRANRKPQRPLLTAR